MLLVSCTKQHTEKIGPIEIGTYSGKWGMDVPIQAEFRKDSAIVQMPIAGGRMAFTYEGDSAQGWKLVGKETYEIIVRPSSPDSVILVASSGGVLFLEKE